VAYGLHVTPPLCLNITTTHSKLTSFLTVCPCRHELQVDDWEDVPFSNETALAAAVSQTPVIVAICCGPAIDDWHHYTGARRNPRAGIMLCEVT
jgi:hypothetical protein